jgi:Sad1 / UNC-like C-terminal
MLFGPVRTRLILTFDFFLESSTSVQEFEVETKFFGGDLPPLRSISLAVDSNWGNAYSCLYRFRVQGEKMEVKSVNSDSIR